MMKQGKKQQNYAVVLITKYFVTFCRLLTLTYRWVIKMIKLREARYCNLKLLLIFLVIYGHTIETQIWHNTVLMTQYKFIYLVHMPLFAFLSGLFITDCRSCTVQLKRLLPIYIVLQTTAYLIKNGTLKLITPYWHLWYLLSCACWIGITWLLFYFAKGKGNIIILMLALFIGSVAGYINIIGREFSLSRTIVFFPYFWLGAICDSRVNWKKFRTAGLVALLIGIMIVYFIGDKLQVTFLYHADPYSNMENGSYLRLLCYFIGFLLGFFLLTWTLDKRFPFTKAGANTMPAYIAHVPFAILLRELNLSWPIYLIAITIFLWMVYKVLQLYGTIYGMVPSDGRNKMCPHFKTCMKNMDEKCTGFCYPCPEAKF